MNIYGWIVYNGFLPGDKFRDYAEMLEEAALERGHKIKLFTNTELLQSINFERWPYNERRPDYVIFTDKDIYLANHLETLGLRLFNRANVIEVSDDKIKTYQHLAKNKINIPNTIIAPKTFGFSLHVQSPFVNEAIQQLGFPLVLKEAFGSFGEQVYLAKNEQQLAHYLHKIGDSPFVFQQFIDTSIGVDLRLQVVGDEVVAAMKRTSITDFRANVTSGGKMEPYEWSEREAKLAIAATQAIGADFAGVDLLFGENDNRYVCEVNSNAHIRNLLDCTGINAAKHMLAYIEQQIEAI